MKYDLFFKLAKEAGIQEAELYINESRSLSVSLFHGEVDNYSDNNGYTILARGIVNGKLGAASCDVWDKEKAAYLVKEIANNGKVIENEDPVIIFGGSPKYKKINTFNKELGNVSIDEKLAKLHELEEKIKAYDERIVEVAGVEYIESSEKVTILNTKGLKLSQQTNYFVYLGQAVARQGDQTKSGYDYLLANDFAKADVAKLAAKIGKETVDQLGGEACESAKYTAILSPDVVKSLVGVLVSHVDAEEVQKQSSLFIGKLDQKVLSSKITIEDKPLNKNVFARWFDDEGVATFNKPIFKNGVLKTYLYNLTTAAKDGVESTGNGYRQGAKMGVSSNFLVVKPGKKSLEELYQSVGNGVLITDVSGLHAGLNPQSGNFSLQSTGYLIKDGKRDRPLDIITISGNLLEVFNNILEVGGDETVFPEGVSTPSLVIKKLAVSGK
ncbi:MAG: TldD/PmbA family protein [Bacilli bacterium]|nr:TldD/PmbA family protein [Bacilli bacterium]